MDYKSPKPPLIPTVDCLTTFTYLVFLLVIGVYIGYNMRLISPICIYTLLSTLTLISADRVRHRHLQQREGQAVPSPAPGPFVNVLTPNWTRIDSSGKKCESVWGGWGGIDRFGNWMKWSFPMTGGDYWLETFKYVTFKEEGKWLAGDSNGWNAQNAAGAKANETLHVSIQPCRFQKVELMNLL